MNAQELTSLITRLEEADRRTSMLYLKASASGMTIVREDESNVASVDEVLGRAFFDMKEAEAIVLFRRGVGELLPALRRYIAIAEAGRNLRDAVKHLQIDDIPMRKHIELVNYYDKALDTPSLLNDKL